MVRLGFIIGFVALLGILLSGLAAYRAYDQELTVDRIALSRAIDVSSSLVQDRLTERELLARVASGLFHSPSLTKANMLQPPLSSGWRLTERCTTVPQSVATSSTFMPIRRSRSAPTSAMALMRGTPLTER